MKKKKVLAGAVASILLFLIGLSAYFCSVKSDSILEQNVEALAEQESGGIYGHCSEEEGICLYVCSNCKAKYEAIGHAGGSYDMGGKCVKCKQEAE